MTNLHAIPTDELELIARLQAGDEAAYETLFRTHVGAMMAIARRFFGDTDNAADAVQDAFLSAFRGIGRFAGTARLGTWLYRITVNACLMQARATGRRRTTSLDDRLPAELAPSDEVVERAETSGQVRACIDQLPPPYRAIIQLRDIEGLDTAATADRLGTNVAVVKTRLHRARHALRALLEPEFAGAV